YDDGEVDEGRAFLYLGTASGLTAAPAWSAEGNQAGARFGASVSGAGDVNGDGYGDVIVGAPGFDDGQTDEGAAFVYAGSGAGLSSNPIWLMEGDQDGAAFGASVAGAGDVDRDGYADVIVGAPGYDHGEIDEGRAYVYSGSAAGPATTPSWVGESNQAGAAFGASVAGAGD